VRVDRLRAVDFRPYAALDVALHPGVTAVVGENGAGKTSLLEALHFGCTGFSPRTSAEAHCVRVGATALRVEIEGEAGGRPFASGVGFQPGAPKRIRVDGVAVRSAERLAERFSCLVFLPDRLALVKRAASVRRAYLDRAVTRLEPRLAEPQAVYARALLQRNALLRRIRAGVAPLAALEPWDDQVAVAGAEVTRARRRLCERLAPLYTERLVELGGARDAVSLQYRPRGDEDAVVLRALLASRRDADVARGATTVGPHLDDVALAERARDVRAYGSQGEQRTAVLALLLAEAALHLRDRGEQPVLLLDDVLSELDARRRGLLVDVVRAHGQAVITATEASHLPSPADRTLEVAGGEAHELAA